MDEEFFGPVTILGITHGNYLPLIYWHFNSYPRREFEPVEMDFSISVHTWTLFNLYTMAFNS